MSFSFLLLYYNNVFSSIGIAFGGEPKYVALFRNNLSQAANPTQNVSGHSVSVNRRIGTMKFIVQ